MSNSSHFPKLLSLTGLTTIIVSSACGGGGSTGDPTQYDGVYVKCLAQDYPNGPGPYQRYVGPQNCGEGVSECVDLVVKSEIAACAGPEEGFDPNLAIEGQEAAAIQACVSQCQNDWYSPLRIWNPLAGEFVEWGAECAPENFTGEVLTYYQDWDPGEVNCEEAFFDRNADVDGSNAVWAIAPTDRPGVNCDLNLGCCDEFSADICQFINAAEHTSSDTRGGDYFSVSDDGSSTLLIDLPDPALGADADDEEALYVEGEFTAQECGEDVCPFYLSHLVADGGDATWDIKVEKLYKKDIDNLRVELMQPVLGMWSPLDGSLLFQDEALRLRVQFDVSGNTNQGNGHYDLELTSDDVVHGVVFGGELSLVTSFPVDEGDGTLTLNLQTLLSPPVPSIDPGPHLECDAPGGWVVSDSIVTSTDPDGGVLSHKIMGDGGYFPDGVTLPLGPWSIGVRSENDRLAAKESDLLEVDILDTIAPELTCPASTQVECSQTGGTPQADWVVQDYLAATVVSDVCDLTPEVIHDAPGFLPVGDTLVSFAAADLSANLDECASTLTVVDTTAPQIDCPEAIIIECNAFGGVDATDPQVAAFLAGVSSTDICDAAPVITNDGPAFFGLGQTAVIFTATDDAGNQTPCESSVTVADTTPPELDVEASPDSLWPPNHKMRDISVGVQVSDICDPNPGVILAAASSNEPDNGSGDGNTINDIQDASVGSDDTSVSLRAERSGNGNGRIYTLAYTATDVSNNSTDDSTSVSVPKSK